MAVKQQLQTVTVKAEARWVRSSARKARIVLANVRGRTVPEARTILRFTQRHVATDIEKVLHSAVSNAEANHGLIGDELVIAAAFANEGPTLKRFRPRARGRASQILKRTCHITILLGEDPKADQRPKRRQATPAKNDAPAPGSTTEERAAEKPKRAAKSRTKKKEAVA